MPNVRLALGSVEVLALRIRPDALAPMAPAEAIRGAGRRGSLDALGTVGRTGAAA